MSYILQLKKFNHSNIFSLFFQYLNIWKCNWFFCTYNNISHCILRTGIAVRYADYLFRKCSTTVSSGSQQCIFSPINSLQEMNGLSLTVPEIEIHLQKYILISDGKIWPHNTQSFTIRCSIIQIFATRHYA